MKKITTLLFILTINLLSCDTFGVAPQPFPILSPIPSITPAIITATPLIIPPPAFTTPFFETITSQPQSMDTETPPPTLTFMLVSSTPTVPQPTDQPISVEILGCNTSIDILHGMGEVTNAFVTLKNTGNADLPNTCGLLRAIDEGREHPDKKVCVSSLPANHQVILKLTVDSTYKKDTVIQVDVLSNEAILLRVDKQSCRDISLFGGIPANTGLVQPIP